MRMQKQLGRMAIACVSTAVITTIALTTPSNAAAQQNPPTIAVVIAHADDEVAAAPILARYAREGARVHFIIVTDGAQGGNYTTIPRGAELARARAEEARCATDALGAQPPILFGLPDGKLGDYMSDPSLLYQLTSRLAAELGRLRPDAIITWGPDGGTGHPDHRLVSNVVTQIVRAGAPGVTERLFYMYLPVEGFTAMNPQRGVPPFVVPQNKYFTAHIPFTPPDLEAARRAMICHRTQYTDEMLQRVWPAMASSLKGVVPLVPAFPTAGVKDLFR